jgi:tetratricopeptide (TPR) repeat protein
MTTIIIIVIAVVVLVVMGSKIMSKGSAKGNPAMAPDSEELSPKKKKKKAKEPAAEKPLKMAPNMNASGTSLFQPPPETPLFTGRKEILKEVAAKTTTPPILIGLHGFSGVGKTCLTIPMSKMFAAQYPGICLFVDMQGDLPRPPSAEDMMRRIILKFHPTQPLPADEKKLAKLYRVVLKKQKGILILDNVAGAKQAKPLIPPTSWLLIITSTNPVVLPKMFSLKLEPMEVLEAHTLLTRWAPEISPSIKEISSVCKGVSLALEIIGKIFAINSTMAPDYFAKKLLEVRKGLGGEDEKGNLIDGVRSALAFSYQMLPENTAKVLRKITVFPGSFTADAASFVCEDPKKLSITGLEKFGLIQLNNKTNRYSMHMQVRKFIQPLLKAGDRGTTEKRHATEFMNILETVYHHVEKGGKDAIKGLRLFDLELENIKAGMEWSRKHCDQDMDAARVCSAYTENGARIIGQRLSPTECIQWFEAALSAATQLEDKEAERKHLLNLGQQYVLLNQSQNAINTLQRALTLCKKEGDVDGQRTALHQLGQICMIADDYPGATKFIEESLELVQGSGEKEEEFKLLVQLTKACIKNKEYNKAVHSGELAMELVQLNEDKPLLVSLFHFLGKGLMETGELAKAFEKFEVGLALSKSIPNAPLQGELLGQISEAAFKAGDISGAMKYLDKGLENARKTKNQQAEGSLIVQLAEIHFHNKNEERAISYFEEALSLSQKTKDLLLKGKALWSWSQAMGGKGNLEEAINRGQKAQKIYEDLKQPEAVDIRAQLKEWSSS